MEIYSMILTLINSFLVRGMFISVLVIFINLKLFKSKINTHYPVVIIKWIIIGYAVLTLLNYLLIIAFTRDSAATIARATDQYWWAFWAMVLSNTLLPFLLLFKKLRYNIYFIFILTIFMNMGWLMESLTIHITIIQRDYSPEVNPYLPFRSDLFTILTVFFVGLILVAAGNLLPNKRKQQIQ